MNDSYKPKNIQVWSHDARVSLYERLHAEVEIAWSHIDWNVTAQRPNTMSSGRFDAIFLKIFMDMRADGFSMFENKPPKSHSALKQQFQWCITTQANMSAPALKNQRRNRMAAYEAGFLSMSEIRWLEEFSDLRFYMDT